MQYLNLNITPIENFILLTINRPSKLNALSPELLLEFKQYLEQLLVIIPTSDIRGLLIIGAGEKAFVAGADIKSMSTMTPEQAVEFAQLGQDVNNLLEQLPLPVIACVDGHALGGGCELAMACDFIYATERSIFGQPEVHLGLVPCFGGCVRLPRKVGPNLARELIFTGEQITANIALSIGLVNKVFKDKEAMLNGAINCLHKITNNSPAAIGLSKKILQLQHSRDTREGLLAERTAFKQAIASSDKNEGIGAFLEKREPSFKGRHYLPTITN